MNKPLLSILVPLTPDRYWVFNRRLLTSLRSQCGVIVPQRNNGIWVNIEALKNIEMPPMTPKEIIAKFQETGVLMSSADFINECEIKYYSFVGNTEIEIITYSDDRVLSIGEKRERLYEFANGVFSWQIDSDDLIAPDAIELILSAIKSNPEIPCITFKENCMMNGEYKSSNHSIKYEKWQDNFDGFDFVRTPFYKDVIRTDIAKSVPFPYIRYNEDEQWSMALKPFLTDEIHIDKELYFYIYSPKESNEERYGLNRY